MAKLGKLGVALVLGLIMCMALLSTGAFAQSASHSAVTGVSHTMTTNSTAWRGGTDHVIRVTRWVRESRLVRVTRTIRVSRVIRVSRLVRVSRMVRVTRFIHVHGSSHHCNRC